MSEWMDGFEQVLLPCFLLSPVPQPAICSFLHPFVHSFNIHYSFWAILPASGREWDEEKFALS